MTNPYAPPTAPIDGEPPAGGPSSIPTAVGVLSIIFGGVTLLGAAMWALALVSVLAAAPENDHVPGPAPLIVPSALLALMSITLLVLGIGLVRKRGWARRLSIHWARAALLELGVGLVLLARTGAGIGFGELVILAPMLLPFVAWPIVLLALMSRPRVIAATGG